ncbi:hypothetical protein Q8F55_008369 [Vanrija albida]|uniref:Chitin-binding type-4 domain-containing protein n=1 Tax=Vanrija albida TaxID=181172 RepID=A0ABR3PW71_9TREE
MVTLLALLAASSLALPALAHMEMQYPPPFRSKFNPHTLSANIDWSMTNPLEPDGSNYPCKGYNHVLGTSEGTVVASFAQGGAYNFTIVGSAFHGGGSCQASLSYDGGKTYTVVQSIIGNCPVFGSGNFDFKIPADAPTGDAVFAWTWFNNIGNREMYMNCAAVTITGAGGHRKRRIGEGAEPVSKRDPVYGNGEVVKRGTPFSARPANFIANVGNGCSTLQNTDLRFPNPGPDVLINSDNLSDVIGVCKAIGGGPEPSSSSVAPTSSVSSSSASPSPSSSSSSTEPTTSATLSSSSVEPTTTTSTAEPTTTPAPSSTTASSSSTEPSSSVVPSSSSASSSSEPAHSSSTTEPHSSSSTEASSASPSTHSEPTSSSATHTSASSTTPSPTPSTTPSPTSTPASSTSTPVSSSHSDPGSTSASSSAPAESSTHTTPSPTTSPCAQPSVQRRGVSGPGKFLVRRRRVDQA